MAKNKYWFAHLDDDPKVFIVDHNKAELVGPFKTCKEATIKQDDFKYNNRDKVVSPVFPSQTKASATRQLACMVFDVPQAKTLVSEDAFGSDIWHPEDKKWMKKRKEEWKIVKSNLDEMTLRISKLHHKYHRDYFLYGKKDPSLGREGGKAFNYSFPLFQIWYLPEINENTIQDIYKQHIHPHAFTKARELFFNIGIGSFDKEYGMMNGREELAVKMLYPGLDWKEIMYFSEKDTSGLPHSDHPDILIQNCINKSSGIIKTGKNNPYSPGQYLWGHIDYAFENYFELISDFMIHPVRRTLRNIIDFHEREDAPRDIPHSIVFKEKLEKKFVNREFCQPLLDLWDDEKRKFEAGVPPEGIGRVWS